MSRSSKGFADFFPAAPSVLQRKRSRVSESRREPAPAAAGSDSPRCRPSTSTYVTNNANERHRHPNLSSNAGSGPLSSHSIQEENDCTQGDLLNGVGSASSSSTASSVFSASNRIPNPANLNGAHQNTSWTPLTQVDASPSRDAVDSPKRDQSHKEEGYIERCDGIIAQELHRTPIVTSGPVARHVRARPGEGKVKGKKINYDPELDKKLSKKDMRVKKPVYVTFGEKVCLTPRNKIYDLGLGVRKSVNSDKDDQ